ncbi:class A beta-lactamase-related serine hydrolase [Seongchinamella sediminis]|uniref:Class A beta-lactamase-related serine hydrolase n=1 Tax=Seongchinamella sediminis TaxID=2283635 RepID=A0A3L7DY42_9GAMM|nr:serine hydrolase domain-containing protein [Seongchinamella sediminis]RLQ22508.1 class A beta-lactamase-related serine hydrolase [Seongchinamella sediminis]
MLIRTVFLSLLAFLPITAVALDVTQSRDGFSLEEDRDYASKAHYWGLLGGGEVASWWSQNISRVMRTAVIPNRLPANTFERNESEWAKRLAEVTADTQLGTMTLAEAISDPRSGAKAMIVIHQGKVVYETYPGLRPADSHLWASVAKPTAALLIEQLIDEGRLRDSDKVEKYLPDFAGTALGDTKIVELMNMVPGTDTHDSPKTRQDPDSVATRYYLAEFDEAYKNGEVETVRDILRGAARTGPAGEVFEYSSGITQMLVFIAEAVTGQAWADAFDDRVWSHVRAEGALQMHLAPDGMALAHGVVSSRLRDLARYGLLYTPYWSLVADRQIVSDAAMARIATPEYGQDVFMKGDGKRFSSYLGEIPVGNSRQWDAVYADGGMFKGGLFGQGLYVSPEEGIVIAYFSTVNSSPLTRFLRPLAKELSR